MFSTNLTTKIFTIVVSLGAIAFILYLYFNINKNKKSDSINPPNDSRAIAFYEECQKRGVTSLSDEESTETAIDILRYNPNFSDLQHDAITAQNLFNQGKTAIDKLNQK